MMDGRLSIISPEGRKAIADYYESGGENRVAVIPLGVSGLDVQQAASAACWRGNRNGQPKGLRDKLARRRQEYRRLVDKGKSVPEIAKIIRVKVRSVYNALRRMGLKIKPRLTDAP